MALDKPTKHAITDDVYLYTIRNPGPPISFTYEIECCKFNNLQFKMDFQGSENFELQSGGLILEATVPPFKRTKVGTLELKDATQGANLKNTYSWDLQEPDPAAVSHVMIEVRTISFSVSFICSHHTHHISPQHIASQKNQSKAKISRELERAKKLNFGDDSATKEEIEKRCSTNKVQFLDPDFPPVDNGLYTKDPKSGSAISDGKPICWRRPTEFMPNGEFDVFQGGIEPNDIRQGALADCWFLCALSSLAEFPELVMNLFEENCRTVSESGVYKLKLCKNGQWQTVTVDDFFPCFPGAGPAYSRGHGNELWVLLLEKVSERSERALTKTRILATTKLNIILNFLARSPPP